MDDRRYFKLDTKLRTLGQRRQNEDPRVTEAFQAEIDAGWLYHDNALEGIVLSYDEIKAALDDKLQLAGREGARREGIRDHKAAIDFVKAQGQAQLGGKHSPITVPLLKQMHELLTPEDKPRGSPYRNGVRHRTYYHELVQAGSISSRMHKLCEAVNAVLHSGHPLSLAATIHIELMTIYPWPENSGKLARLLMNLMLLRDGYPPAVIRGIDRQRYYASLHEGDGWLAELLTDTLNNYCDTANQFLDELAELRKSRGAS